MKIKTSTRISFIFSIFTFLLILIILILLNIFSFYGWYNEELDEVNIKINHEYTEVLEEYSDFNIQKNEITEDIVELGGFVKNNTIFDEKSLYKNIILNLYKKEELYYIIYKRDTEFGNIFLPYEVTTYVYTQIRLIKIGIILLFIFSFLSFLISKFLFIKLALKDILYISSELKNIDLNNIKIIKLDLNKNDEINIILNSINSFLEIIDKNTKTLKRFNSQVSHEFKTPLMVISSELEYLSESGKNNDSYKKIENQIYVLNELLETFLFISKIESLRGNVIKKETNISELIISKIDSLNEIYKEKNIEIIFDFKENIKIKTDEKLFSIIIQNILDNAFKYNKKGGSINLKLTNNYLEIKDTGIGIKNADLDEIFDFFHKLDSSVKGYGVGLNIVKTVVDILGYEIKVKSEENIGTEFKINFN